MKKNRPKKPKLPRVPVPKPSRVHAVKNSKAAKAKHPHRVSAQKEEVYDEFYDDDMIWEDDFD